MKVVTKNKNFVNQPTGCFKPHKIFVAALLILHLYKDFYEV